MQVFSDFNIMNRASSGKAVTPRSILEVRYRRWGVLPARRRVDGFRSLRTDSRGLDSW